MEIINSIMSWVMKKRIHDIDLFLKYPVEVQNEIFNNLIRTARKTEFGQKYGYGDIKGGWANQPDSLYLKWGLVSKDKAFKQ